jgi:hypothetical protein
MREDIKSEHSAGYQLTGKVPDLPGNYHGSAAAMGCLLSGP